MAELEAQIKDNHLRSVAEMQNIHRRAERDVESARKYALEKFAGRERRFGALDSEAVA